MAVGRKPYNSVGPGSDVAYVKHPTDLKPTLYSPFYITLQVREAGPFTSLTPPKYLILSIYVGHCLVSSLLRFTPPSAIVIAIPCIVSFPTALSIVVYDRSVFSSQNSLGFLFLLFELLFRFVSWCLRRQG